jgi:GNAT superfamily N-acetyltransferase
MDGAHVGWLTLIRGKSAREANLDFGVVVSHRGQGIGSLLLETALTWAGAQNALRRLCLKVRADDLSVSCLCGQYGFVEQGQAACGSGIDREQMTLARDL